MDISLLYCDILLFFKNHWTTLFSGIGGTILVLLGKIFLKKKSQAKKIFQTGSNSSLSQQIGILANGDVNLILNVGAKYTEDKTKEALKEQLPLQKGMTKEEPSARTRLQPHQKNPQYACKNSFGSITFDYSANDGIFTVGMDDYEFDINFSTCSNDCIYLYKDPENIDSIAIAERISNINEINDAGIYDYSSRSRTLFINHVALLKNANGYIAAIKIKYVKCAYDKKDNTYEVQFEYAIQIDKLSNSFSRDSSTVNIPTPGPIINPQWTRYCVCPWCKYSGLSPYDNQCPNCYRTHCDD